MYSGTSSAGANPPAQPPPAPSFPRGAHTYAHEEEDDEDENMYTFGEGDDNSSGDIAQCCCKVTRAVLTTIENVDAAPENGNVASSKFKVLFKMTYRPGKTDPDPDACTLKWEERTTKTHFVPPRRLDAEPVEGETEVPQGPQQEGKPEAELTPRWIDVGPHVRDKRGVARRHPNKEPTWNELLPKNNCPEEVRWRYVDNPFAGKDFFPRTLLVKVTVENGKGCPGSTTLKFLQRIDGQGHTTSEPAPGSGPRGSNTHGVEGGKEQDDPKGWSEPKEPAKKEGG